MARLGCHNGSRGCARDGRANQRLNNPLTLQPWFAGVVTILLGLQTPGRCDSVSSLQPVYRRRSGERRSRVARSHAWVLERHPSNHRRSRVCGRRLSCRFATHADRPRLASDRFSAPSRRRPDARSGPVVDVAIVIVFTPCSFRRACRWHPNCFGGKCEHEPLVAYRRCIRRRRGGRGLVAGQARRARTTGPPPGRGETDRACKNGRSLSCCGASAREGLAGTAACSAAGLVATPDP